MNHIADILAGIAVASTPLVYAALGELVAEKAGVLNLGVEGMMVLGALAGFAAFQGSGSYPLAFGAAMAAGIALALVFTVLTQTLHANQVASGLAVSMLGLGLSALLGQGYAGQSAPAFPVLPIPGLPVDALACLSIAAIAAVALTLKRTRTGLNLRAAGENPHSARTVGLPVVTIRYAAILFGGAMAGLGGSYLSLVQTPLWAEGMTAGRGWIALALVVFAGWRPWRLLFGAYLFGGIIILQLHAQGLGVRIPAQYLSILPYLATILVLILMARDKTQRLSAPASLGKAFYGGG